MDLHLSMVSSGSRCSVFASLALVFGTGLAAAQSQSQAPRAGNPVVQGWYADPEAPVLPGRYSLYPTYPAPYDQQRYMDAVSATDPVTWQKQPRLLDAANGKWAKRAMWAPSIVEKDRLYYLFFGAN